MGIVTLDTTQERGRLNILQLMSLLSVGSMSAFVVLYLYIDISVLFIPALFSGSCILPYLLAFFFGRKGWGFPGKITFLVTLGGSVFVATYFLVGREPGLHYFFLLSALLPLLLWPLKKPFWIVVFVALNLGSFLFIHLRTEDPTSLLVKFPEQWIWFTNAISLASVYFFTLLILYFFQRWADSTSEQLREKADSLEQMLTQVEILSRTDPLTGLLNRRAMTERMNEELSRLGRTQSQFALLICDLDFFKTINDEYGHEAGDQVLIQLSTLMKESLRIVDHTCRWGGEEFLILLPDTDERGAMVTAEKIRQSTQNHNFTWRSIELHISLTFGVTIHDSSTESLKDSIRRADMALYKGKREGRNRSVFFKNFSNSPTPL